MQSPQLTPVVRAGKRFSFLDNTFDLAESKDETEEIADSEHMSLLLCSVR